MEIITNNEKAVGIKGGTTEVTIEEGEHLRINTPNGLITIFVGNHYSSITSWVDDTNYTGFYTNNATKKSVPCNDKVKQIVISPKGF